MSKHSKHHSELMLTVTHCAGSHSVAHLSMLDVARAVTQAGMVEVW